MKSLEAQGKRLGYREIRVSYTNDVARLGRRIACGDVLLDVACSPPVRTVIQSIFPGVRLRAVDIEVLWACDRVSLNAAHAILFGIRDQEGAPTLELIERVRSIAPHVGLFVVEDQRAAIDPWLRRLAASGADDAFALDRMGDERLLRFAISSRVSLPPPESALRKLWSYWTNCSVREEAMHCVRNAYRVRHGFSTSEWFGLQERTMRDQFHRAMTPSPFILTRYGVELHWFEGTARGWHTRAELARLLGFETVSQAGKDRARVRKRAASWPVYHALLG